MFLHMFFLFFLSFFMLFEHTLLFASSIGQICIPILQWKYLRKARNHVLWEYIIAQGDFFMEYTKLGNSDLKVSRICMGCMGFGNAKSGIHSWTLDEEHSRAILKRGLELGVNFFDTAAGYQSGTSEQYLGRALNDFAKRDEVVVATKFFPRSPQEIAGGVSGKDHILGLLDRSLTNLGMDYVDLYICHMWDYHTPVEEMMEALNSAVVTGKVRAIGISNCFAWQLAKANYIADKNGWAKFVSIQGHYNLLFREEEREMVPFCKDQNIALTPYSPLASGRLAKKPSELSKRLQEDTYAKGKYDATKEKDAIIIDRVGELAKKKGLTRIQISLGWLLTKVTAPVVGATKVSHIEEGVKAIGVQLTPDETAYLEEPYVPHALVGVMRENP